MTVSDEILKRSADSYRRIRNTVRFMLANTTGFDPAQHSVETNDMLDLDRWIVSKAANLQVQILDAYEHYNFHNAIQLILNFCSNDLGGFYLDVIKDRQYTTQENSRARRSAQTALNHILEAMVKWLSPVLSYTAEEVWQSMPSEKTNSIFLAEWYTNLASGYDNVAIDAARNINPFIRKQMEGMRSDKVIGSSLDAEVDLYCDENNYNALSQLGDELRFVFITSYARIHPLSDKTDNCIEAGEGVFVEVTKSEHEKCVRCWHHREDVGQNAEHEELCGRCVENIAGNGEQREFA
jgi:isoleucyl-tRNA synthetase